MSLRRILSDSFCRKSQKIIKSYCAAFTPTFIEEATPNVLLFNTLMDL